MNQFKVYKSVIANDLIDKINAEFEKMKRSPFNSFRAQGETSFEGPRLDPYGNQINSIHNPLLSGYFPTYTDLLKKVFFGQSVLECLRDFYGFDEDSKFIHYQSMQFDKSTATKLHQDTWYLDTTNQSLVGVWFAMEDIVPGSGPFCLYSDTDSARYHQSDFDFENIEEDQRFTNKFPTSKRFDFYAEKGDILIWNSKVIHGALTPDAGNTTRTSLTSHYYPLGDQIQDAPIKRFFSIYNHDKPKSTFNKNIFQATTIHPLIFQTLCTTLRMIGKYKNLITKDTTVDESHSKIRNIE